jgi:hypothetical protein
MDGWMLGYLQSGSAGWHSDTPREGTDIAGCSRVVGVLPAPLPPVNPSGNIPMLCNTLLAWGAVCGVCRWSLGVTLLHLLEGAVPDWCAAQPLPGNTSPQQALPPRYSPVSEWC